MKNNPKLILMLGTVLFSSLLLSACGKKTPAKIETINPVSNQTFEINENERPYISLIPRSDGHQLTLKIKGAPASVSKIEYELLYSAEDKDSGLEMEKGVSGTIQNDKSSNERDLLLGTESCTNGCKYKYDDGITGGTLSLNFINKNGQTAQFVTPFTIKSSNDFKKSGTIGLSTENFDVKFSSSYKSGYYILIKNFGLQAYSLFSSSTKPLVSDYPIK
ncbi:MAG: hypothetical protein Q8P53_01415 [Candidatus Shapirobacteria bacterium]|nr:hypothetical protein [Candidatus Shapirobacteria bacterium]